MARRSARIVLRDLQNIPEDDSECENFEVESDDDEIYPDTDAYENSEPDDESSSDDDSSEGNFLG